MTSATADPRTVREIKASSVQRVIGRRKVAEFRTVAGATGDVRVCVNDTAPEFRPASSLPEWADDLISRTTLCGPVSEVLVVILEAARTGGARNAAAAVAAAGKLGAWNQYLLCGAISALHGTLPDVAGLLREIRAEWRRIGLPVTRPDGPMVIEGPHIRTNAAPGTAYGPGVPQEMRAAWAR